MVLMILLFDFCQLYSEIYFLGRISACMILFYPYLWKSVMGNMAGEITNMNREFLEQQLIPMPIKSASPPPPACFPGVCVLFWICCVV